MPLESIGNEQINIHDLTIEEEKKPESEAQKQYEELKETLLYDAEKEQWNWKMDKDQGLRLSERYALTQLLGVLVETQFDKPSARELHSSLEKTELYDSIKNQWKTNMGEDQVLIGPNRDSDAQLVSVLVESQLDLDLARKSYEDLKRTPLYDAEKKQWNTTKYENDDSIASGDVSLRYSHNQLLGILVESKFNRSSAEKMYEALKKSVLYDSERKQWNHFMNKDQTIHRSDFHTKQRYASDQLFGVLIEAQFNKTTAREMYRALKGTRLYDAERKQWNWDMDENQNLEGSDRLTNIQLLGILCEREFEEPEGNITSHTPPLPEERNY